MGKTYMQRLSCEKIKTQINGEMPFYMNLKAQYFQDVINPQIDLWTQ